ncbi:MAG: hypothetical protein ACTSU2_07690 [Promethearchaeota archaeon]
MDIEKVTPDSVHLMAEKLGENINEKEIIIKPNWKKYKKYFIYDKNKKPIYFIKSVWEYGVIKEVLALHSSINFLDRELVPEKYLFGLHYPKGPKRDPEPYILTPIVPGAPIKKHDWERFAYNLGRQFYQHQILSLYDCDLRHFFASERSESLKAMDKFREAGTRAFKHNNSHSPVDINTNTRDGGVQQGQDSLIKNQVIKRIDFGLSFSKLYSRYRGFEEFMPKGLPYMSEFWRGYEAEKIKIEVILLNTRNSFKTILDEIKKLKEDDLTNFNGVQFINELINYWEREKLPVLDFPNYES